MFFLKCLHFLNAIEIWLNFHLNNKNEVQNINQPLSHDQINKIVEGISVHRKLFIRGLKFHTTSETLYQTFSTYGEIEKAFMVIDKFGLSKEYDFVIFKNIRSALMALKEPCKNIDGKITVTKIAKLTTRDIDDESLRTIYVSNVPRDMFPGKLYEYFSSYNVIEKGPFRYNKQSGKSKGYAIFVYRTLEGAKSAIYEPNKRVDGHYLTCEMAIPRKMMKKSRFDPNLCFDFGPDLHDRYNNARSRFDGCGSRPIVSQYSPYQGNGQMYAQKCDCGLGLNHMGFGLCSGMAHSDYNLWASNFQGPNHYGFDGSSRK